MVNKMCPAEFAIVLGEGKKNNKNLFVLFCVMLSCLKREKVVGERRENMRMKTVVFLFFFFFFFCGVNGRPIVDETWTSDIVMPSGHDQRSTRLFFTNKTSLFVLLSFTYLLGDPVVFKQTFAL